MLGKGLNLKAIVLGKGFPGYKVKGHHTIVLQRTETGVKEPNSIHFITSTASH
jgi:hypothetical protein